MEKIVTYRGKKYKVLWREYSYCEDNIEIWEDSRRCAWNMDLFNDWEQVRYYSESYIKERIDITEDDPNYYIEEIKELFKVYQKELDKEESERNRLKVLEEWDGVIE